MPNHSKFSTSEIWEFQRNYFREKGIKAWSSGDVPHYITSNPFTAETFANLILAFLRDLTNKQQAIETIYILELGAGSGRFTYHILKALFKKLESVSFVVPTFKYVITDFIEENILFCQDHPRLKSFFSQGILDTALFDAEKDEMIFLRGEKKAITFGSLTSPMIVLANYFFDSIPQDLYHIHHGEIEETLINIKNKTISDSDSQNIEAMHLDFKNVTLSHDLHDDFSMDLLNQYRKNFHDTYVLLSQISIQSINRLKGMSKSGILLISADKGIHRLEDLDHKSKPYIAKHGSFSLEVNFHAFKVYCEKNNGLALFPQSGHYHINIGCLIMVPEAEQFSELRHAYRDHVNDFGPDHFFSIKKYVQGQIEILDLKEMLSFVRLSQFDASLFMQFIPQFHELVSSFTNNDRLSILSMVSRVWDGYYPIGESKDLAMELGILLHKINFPKEALGFYELSEKLFGGSQEALLYNRALCLISLGESESAALLLKSCVVINDNSLNAKKLLQLLEEEERKDHE